MRDRERERKREEERERERERARESIPICQSFQFPSVSFPWINKIKHIKLK